MGEGPMEFLLTIVIGIALLPVVQSFVDGANQTGTNKTLLDLVPLFWILGVVGVAAIVGYRAWKKH